MKPRRPVYEIEGVAHRRCSKCDLLIPLEGFNKNRSEADGLAAWCRSCANRAVKKSSIKKLYGITLSEWDAMFAAQSGVCAACQEPCKTGTALSVDHDHDTGEVRALLCRRCNSALGLVDEDPAKLQALIDYINAYIPKRIRS